ncbi:alpha/beta fold hydrolase [Xanthomonas massiliensis]|uniref:alpha/beta fold hydrolase n=1 Tax=Xanthomonas massiliensis TaxID=1720302 RepID=UPI0008259829|nr:alpha/beta fold hydrolase [Xanthomonas massiliensis]
MHAPGAMGPACDEMRESGALLPRTERGDLHAVAAQYQPPLLAVWGRNDPFFLPAGAKAWKRDIPHADVRFYDTCHLALETHGAEIGAVIRAFLDRNVGAA